MCGNKRQTFEHNVTQNFEVIHIFCKRQKFRLGNTNPNIPVGESPCIFKNKIHLLHCVICIYGDNISMPMTVSPFNTDTFLKSKSKIKNFVKFV